MFKKDLAVGKAAEESVCEVFRGIGATAKLAERANPYWDIEVNYYDCIFTVEVKNDRMALLTGNIAVEYYNSKKNEPSGLLITTADIWSYVIGTEIWMLKTDLLKEFVDQNKCWKHIEGGGDDNADLLLYKKNHIMSHFTKFNGLKKADIEKKMTEWQILPT